MIILTHKHRPCSSYTGLVAVESIETLRKKQNELVDLQIELNKILIANAKITQNECKEKWLYARALRINAEANTNTHE